MKVPHHFGLYGTALLLTACGAGPGETGPSVVNPISGPLTGISGPVTFSTQNAKLRYDCATCSVNSWQFGLSNDHQIEIDPTTGTVTIIDYGSEDDSFLLDFLGDSASFASATNYESIYSQQTLKMLLPGVNSGYEWSSYGVFASTFYGCLFSCASTFQGEVFSFGVITDNNDMPTGGTASYTGAMDGFYSHYTQQAVRIHGAVSMSVNFSDKRLTGQISNITSSVIFGSSRSFGDMAFNASIAGNIFDGTATGSADGYGLTGTVSGSFYGPQAMEAGGVIHMTGTLGTAVAAFAAKQ